MFDRIGDQFTNYSIDHYFNIIFKSLVVNIGRKINLNSIRQVNFIDKITNCFGQSEIIKDMWAKMIRDFPDALNCLIYCRIRITKYHLRGIVIVSSSYGCK